jgi:hypothetical protein
VPWGKWAPAAEAGAAPATEVADPDCKLTMTGRLTYCRILASCGWTVSVAVVVVPELASMVNNCCMERELVCRDVPGLGEIDPIGRSATSACMRRLASRMRYMGLPLADEA